MYMTNEYLIAHRSSGINIGDIVTITRSSFNEEQGWDNSWSWYGFNKDINVGKSFKVLEDNNEYGFALDDGHEHNYPYFILKKIEPKIDIVEKIPISINNEIFYLPQCIIDNIQISSKHISPMKCLINKTTEAKEVKL